MSRSRGQLHPRHSSGNPLCIQGIEMANTPAEVFTAPRGPNSPHYQVVEKVLLGEGARGHSPLPQPRQQLLAPPTAEQ